MEEGKPLVASFQMNNEVHSADPLPYIVTTLFSTLARPIQTPLLQLYLTAPCRTLLSFSLLYPYLHFNPLSPPYPTLPYPTQPCLTLSCPFLPYRTVYCLTLPFSP
jgi:hypothetical protein